MNWRSRARRGLSMIEAVVSIIVVSVMLVAALSAAAAARATQLRGNDRQQGLMLAQLLMTEIVSKPYEEPTELSVLGLELSELSGLRTVFDDVDDYNGYEDTPPKALDGSPIDGYTGWSRSVTVQLISSSDFATASLTDQGFKRITIVVKHGEAPVARLVAVRGKAKDAL